MSAAREARRERRASRRAARGRYGSVVGATWLIGLGLVFLIQQLADMPWVEAWPMFVILGGVAGLVSGALGYGWRGRSYAGLGWSLMVLVIGILLLLSTTGALGVGPVELVSTWWPLALIVLGAWFLVAALIPRAAIGADHLELPLGGASEASVVVRFGGGELSIGPAPAGTLVGGDFEGIPARHRMTGPGAVELEPEAPGSWPWWDRTPAWRVGVAGDVPLELRVESGAAKVRLDLAETKLHSLRMSTGASETRVRLPRAAGETRVRAEGGAASITFEVPMGVAARITSKMALGSSRIDEAQFPRVAGGWESPDYASAQNRVELSFSGGVGQLQVIRG